MEIQETIRTALESCLTRIQQSLGKQVPQFTDGFKPIDQLDGFDSELWPIASGMLQVELGISIPGKTNLFRDALTKNALTMAQIVQRVADSFDKWKASPLVAVGATTA
jgi:hypothetical protein